MRLALSSVLVLLVAACSSGGSSLSVSTRVAASGSASAGPAAPVARALALGDRVTLDRARVVIRKVELETEGASDRSGDGSSGTLTGSRAAEGSESSGSDGEIEVHAGPILVDLAGPQLDGGVVLQFESEVPAGTYDEGTFQVHKLTPGQSVADPAFTANGDSIRLDLTVDGATYVFTSDLTAVAEIDGPITVPDGGTANVTIVVDPSGWFTARDGGFLDPTLEANRQQIELNIKASIRGFEDDDRDGTPDPS